LKPTLQLLASFLALAVAGAGMPRPRAAGTYAITGVRVLDVAAGRYSPPSVVIVAGTRIARIVDAGGFRPASGDSVIDLSGAYLLPGLIDAHVHLTLGGTIAANAAATLRAGFTTVVDLGARAHRVLRFRDSVNAGLALGPRILAAGQWIGIQGGVCEFNGIGVAGGAEALRHRVRENVDAGADVIKLCVSGWPAEAFANPEKYELDDARLSASVSEAHASRRLVIAHDLSRAGVAAALRLGVDGFAHAAYVDSSIASEMKRRNAFMMPTLASLTTGDSSAAARQLIAAVTLAQKTGVKMVFGTDAGVIRHGDNAIEFPALVNAGLSPIEAIRAATTNAATSLRLADSVGVVRPGMVADLVAFDVDPLKEIEALQKPRFVMARGSVVR
jgi:imidazolonepropionase-like amidohydrolase